MGRPKTTDIAKYANHTEILPVKCTFCQTNLSSITEWREHTLKKHALGGKKCPFPDCSNTFPKGGLGNHMTENHAEGPFYQCKLCRNRPTFTRDRGLVYHFKKEHSHVDESHGITEYGNGTNSNRADQSSSEGNIMVHQGGVLEELLQEQDIFLMSDSSKDQDFNREDVGDNIYENYDMTHSQETPWNVDEEDLGLESFLNPFVHVNQPENYGSPLPPDTSYYQARELNLTEWCEGSDVEKLPKVEPPNFAASNKRQRLADGFVDPTDTLVVSLKNLNLDPKAIFFAAARAGNTQTMKILVERGEVSPNVRNGDSEDTALMICADYGQTEAVRYLCTLLNVGEVNARNINKQTSLFMAAGKGFVDIVEILLNTGADVNLGDDDSSPLLEAASACYLDVLQLFLNHPDTKVDLPDKDGTTALMASSGACYQSYTKQEDADKRRPEAVRMLLRAGANANLKDIEGWTALFWCIDQQYWNVLDVLLERQFRVDLNVFSNCGETALMLAVASNKPDIVEKLIHNGAIVNTMNDDFVSALTVAEIGGFDKITEMLRTRGAVLGTKEPDGACQLKWAVMCNNCMKVAELLDQGVDINSQSRTGYTALHTAAILNFTEICSLLLKRNINVNVRTFKSSSTALMVAAEHNKFEAVKMILGAPDVKVDEKDFEGETALSIAVVNDNLEIVDLLVRKGARVNTYNNEGYTPLKTAEWKQYSDRNNEIIRILRKASNLN